MRGNSLAVKIKDSIPEFLKGPREEILEIEPLSIVGDPCRKRSVHKFIHKAGEKTYEYPRIILLPEFMDMVGRSYRVFRSRAVYRELFTSKEIARTEGDCIVLFFPRKEDKKES